MGCRPSFRSPLYFPSKYAVHRAGSDDPPCGRSVPAAQTISGPIVPSAPHRRSPDLGLPRRARRVRLARPASWPAIWPALFGAGFTTAAGLRSLRATWAVPAGGGARLVPRNLGISRVAVMVAVGLLNRAVGAAVSGLWRQVTLVASVRDGNESFDVFGAHQIGEKCHQLQRVRELGIACFGALLDLGAQSQRSFAWPD